jgi:bifunctional UDP-N-acetylglucosamine pyrophosphorylase/glucosamine-1-phosphate N-acetyltransferase
MAVEEKPEKAENPLINTGIYVFQPNIFDAVKNIEAGQKDLTDAVTLLLEEQDGRFEMVEDYWIDIGSPEKLRRADRIKRDYMIMSTEIDETADIHENVEILGDAVVEENAVLKPGTVLEGKVFVGAGSIIGPNTVLKNTTVSRESLIGAANIESSLVFEKNILDATVFVEASVLAEDVDIKPGTVIRESFIGAGSFIDMNNSIRGVQFVPDARTDLSEISK